MRTGLSVVLLVVVLGLSVAPADAAPILAGHVIEASYLFPNTSTLYDGPTTATVGAGTELPNFAAFADVDFSDTNILITLRRDAFINDVAFDGFRFFDVSGTIPSFTGALLNPATNYTGLNAARLTFDANTIFLNVANLAGLNGQVISIDLAAAAETVPEPSSLLLLGTGLLGLVHRQRRKQR